jgi:hypothetical protein
MPDDGSSGYQEIAKMALHFGPAHITRFKAQADSITKKARIALAKADQAVDTVITTSEVSAASFLFGLAQGKFGGVAVFGVPIDLLSGLGLHVLAFAGIGGKNSYHLHSFGDGALASFFGGLGRQVGRQIQTPADRERMLKHGAKTGILPDGTYAVGGVTGGASLADEELARMVAAGRK